MDYRTVANGACEKIEEAVNEFCIRGSLTECGRCGSGHIHDTFLLCAADDQGEEWRYILQRINTDVFKNPEGLMKNISDVTDFLREKIRREGGDADRETVTLIKTRHGLDYYVDSAGTWWRMYKYITDTVSRDTVEQGEDFYQSARAFGHFQRLLEDYPVEKLIETIPDFHNTPKRFETFCKAVSEDVQGRAGGVQEEIAFLMARKGEISIIMDGLKNGTIPYRVTHNDTKLNNVLLDAQSKKALCVIDLDTIMPGSSLFDYGDSIRFGANTAAEDEKDLSMVSLSLSLMEAYTRGFLEECGENLTEEEIRLLPWGAKLMTLESGIRFLTDYLEGDQYFRIHRPEHNLDRARTQLALVADMERKWEQMNRLAGNSN